MDTQIEWKQGLQFNGINSDGVTLPIDTAASEGGQGDAFRPLELILIGLAGCTGMDVISILKKKQQVVSQFTIKVHADRASDHPKVFTDITIEYLIGGTDLNPEAVKRAVELSETKYCSAMAMLKKNSPIHTQITIL